MSRESSRSDDIGESITLLQPETGNRKSCTEARGLSAFARGLAFRYRSLT